jgi:glycogen debranching enzyme
MTARMAYNKPGVFFGPDGVRFTVVSQHATQMTLCLFDKGGNREISRHAMNRAPGSVFTYVASVKPGQRYGYRADGPWLPQEGHRFDSTKLLVDPHATRLDRQFKYHADLSRRGADTHKIVPKGIVEKRDSEREREMYPLRAGGLVYEVPVRAFTKLNLEIPEAIRGTLAAIAHPASIAHFKKLGVAGVELMPVTAWIDERHLAVHHLTNAWGYNPVAFMALDPRLAPGGIAELRQVADALHAEGISLLLDVVFNHSGESDTGGPVLSMRGLDNALYYRHHADEPGALVNDTGTGNTLAVERGPVRELVIEALRHFVLCGGVDGFRFDLGTTLGRTSKGFSAHAPLFEAIRHDPVLSECTLIAEPWDIGPGGYQLGQFPPQFLEWNDRYRDDLRRFWRGDRGTLGALATRLTGSSDVFGHGAPDTRSVNFLAAHDGFTLVDLTAYRRKHNHDNGEDNRDGHGESFSWNHGHEGASPSPAVNSHRKDDVKALLSLLFLSRGTPMLTAGDEFGRTQKGNNNAYAQDNEITWLNWEKRDIELENFTASLSSLRTKYPYLMSNAFLTGLASGPHETQDIFWFHANGEEMTVADWENPENGFLGFVLSGGIKKQPESVAVVINRNAGKVVLHLPSPSKRCAYLSTISTKPIRKLADGFEIAPNCVAIFTAEPQGRAKTAKLSSEK